MDIDSELEQVQIQIPTLLTDQEYYSNAIFSSDLLGLYDFMTLDGIYCWRINGRDGYIQQGKFKDKENPISWAIIYQHDSDGAKKILMNLGDLLVHVPFRKRLEWKEYFVGLETEFKNAHKLLFCDLLIPEERDYFVRFWKERINKSS